MPPHRPWLSALAVLAAFASTACSGGEAPAPSKDGFAQHVRQILAEARAGGADDEQVALLERAEELGIVSYEDARVAATSALECMAGRGVTGEMKDMHLPNGVTIPAYAVKAEREDAQQIMDDCSLQHDFWVNKLYQLQPSSMEANDAYIDAQRPVILACLADAGYPLAGDVSRDQLMDTADTALHESGATCLADAGVVTH